MILHERIKNSKYPKVLLQKIQNIDKSKLLVNESLSQKASWFGDLIRKEYPISHCKNDTEIAPANNEEMLYIDAKLPCTISDVVQCTYDEIRESEYPKVLLKRLNDNHFQSHYGYLLTKMENEACNMKEFVKKRRKSKLFFGSKSEESTNKYRYKSPNINFLQEEYEKTWRYNPETNRNECLQCNYSCVSKSNKNILLHLLKHKNITLHSCSQCDFKTLYKESLVTHSIKHIDSKPVQCPKCNFTSKWSQSLYTHTIVAHSEKKRFKCSKCPYESNRKSLLNSHFQKHTTIKGLKCSMCSHISKTKQLLKCHISLHSDSEFLVCDLCKFKTRRKYRMNLHKLDHANIKRFKCYVCSFATNCKQNLKKHLLRHDNKLRKDSKESSWCACQANSKNHFGRHKCICSDVNGLKCPYCLYVANNLGQLTTHVKRH